MERDGTGAGNPAMSCGNNLAFGFDASAKPGTFMESGRYAASSRPEVKANTPADGKIAGFDRINGREAAVVANDFAVKRPDRISAHAREPVGCSGAWPLLRLSGVVRVAGEFLRVS
jgi:hypothetical protein